jgi:hypothetical protein
MTAKLTISLSPDVLKALQASKSITVALASGGGGGSAPRATSARAARSSAGAAPKGPAGFRAGSLPAKLMGWAGGLKKPFGVPELMKKFRIKRGHASMLVAYVVKAGAVRRVGRGAYSAA